MATEIYKKLGLKIRQLRSQKQLTRAKLAELACIDDYYLGEIERGTKRATLDTLQKIANALDIKVSDLLKLIEEE